MTNYQPIISKINSLYITERKQYLTMNKKGEYATLTKGKNSNVGLNDSLLKQHLQGSKTIGIFSGSQFSKFICFDIDMIDKAQTKWITMHLMNSLEGLGFNESQYHLSSSGNKGCHVLIFADKPIPLSAFKTLFIMTMEQLQSNLSDTLTTKLHKGNELVLEINDVCNIEFRPSNSQGLKIELGRNYKNKDNDTNKCLFMDKDTFELIDDVTYFLNIQAMDGDIIEMIVEEYEHVEEVIVEAKKLVIENVKESHAHKLNRDEDETIERIKELLINGMYTRGSRHNSIFKIARYFNYIGLDINVAINELKEWMSNQDKKFYTSDTEFALSECERIVKVVYEKGYTLVGEIKNLHIYKDEMIEVMKIKEKNAKILLFTMLLHSKRFANQNGVFYMTYAQMEEMCGLGRKSATNNITLLEELNLLEVVERDVKQSGTHIKKPNKYKIKLQSNSDISVLEVDNSNNMMDLYYKSIINSFTNKELKEIVSDRQYRELTKYRTLVS